MTTPSQPVIVAKDHRGVLTLTLNRPHKNNAYDGALIAAASAALDGVAGMTDARALVIRGAGRHFQAGADLDWLDSVSRQSAEANLAASHAVGDLMRRLNVLPIPTVALVQGACFGGGTGLIASCDVVIAASNANFSIAETRWGMIAGIIIPQLNDAMGVRQVRRYALTGERFDAVEALRIGLIHKVVAPETLDSAGEAAVDALLQNAPQANAITKAITLEHAWSSMPETEFRQLVTQHAERRQSAEAAEGLASFREKRAASWYRTA